MATYPVFNETYDEGAHLATGIELLDAGRYAYDPQHPPLVRLFIALGPYLGGVRSAGLPDMWSEGRYLLHSGDPLRLLALARLGVLPFFLLALFGVWRATHMVAGRQAALVALALGSLTPMLLAHGSVATTDMGMASTLVIAVVAAMRWLRHPTRGSALSFGAALGLMAATKLSAWVTFAATALLVLLVRWAIERGRATAGRASTPNESAGPVANGSGWRALTQTAGVVVGVAMVALWGTYGFRFGEFSGRMLPLGDLLRGVDLFLKHNSDGHAAYLLGSTYAYGDWRFFVVGLAVKAPLTLLVCGTLGLALMTRRAFATGRWEWAVAPSVAVASLAVSLPAQVNIGVRHILPVFLMLAVGAGVALTAAWERWRGQVPRALVALATAAGMWSTARVHPDYLAYFNELAGQHPERILVDSDLDWGQDLLRLKTALDRQGADSVTTAYFGTAIPSLYGIATRHAWKNGEPVHGWFAVSLTRYMRGEAQRRSDRWDLWPDALRWLDAYEPVERVGRSILLYKLP